MYLKDFKKVAVLNASGDLKNLHLGKPNQKTFFIH